MHKYIVHRLLQMVPVLLFISIVVFVLVRVMPVDPIYVIAGEEAGNLSPETRAALERQLGIDKPVVAQYGVWIKDMMTGNWGKSFRSKRPVVSELKDRVPHTLQLAVTAYVISVVLGVGCGVVAALKRNSIWDVSATTGAMFGIALPDFWFGLMLILVFSVALGWLPVFGSELLWHDPVSAIRHLVLPATVLGLNGSATIMRQTRSALLEVLGEDYIRTARAKGLAERSVIWLHGVRNSMLPVVTILGLRLGNILGGAVVIETMFSWPGVGRMAVTALQTADYPVVQVIVLMSGVTVMLANLLTDITYAYLDPRIRYS